MLSGKFRGVIVGLALSALVSGTALAGWLGPTTVAPLNEGYNTPIWAQHTAGTSTLYQRYCDSEFGHASVKWNYMHHWPLFPSTGIGEKSVDCYNNSTWRSKSWTVESGVDYSAENRSWWDIYSDTWKIYYPGS
ncbi:MAG: hypothetical protein AB1736_07910 [Chloroflexota bacterium]